MTRCSTAPIASARPDRAALTLGRPREMLVVRFIDAAGVPFDWSAIAGGLCRVPEFRELWHRIWAEIPFDFQWKPVPIYPGFASSHPFFAVVVPSSFRVANPAAYQEHLQVLASNDLVAVFPNLSGDAQLVVPQALGSYGHMAAFCRTAPSDLLHCLWTRVGELADVAIQQGSAVWCNTHGHGVPWMHVRFDRSLKYAVFPPYGALNKANQILWYQTIYAIAYPMQ